MDLKKLFEPKTMAVIGVSLTNDRHPVKCGAETCVIADARIVLANSEPADFQ